MISLASTVTKKLLAYFFMNQEEERYLNELARILDVDAKNLDVKIKELEKEGLFKSRFGGRQKYYSLNKNYPLFQEYGKIVAGTFGFENVLKTILQKVKGVEEVYIFGSYASNKMDEASDVDLLVIGKHKTVDLQKELLSVQRQFSRELNIVDMTKAEFEERKQKKDPFMGDIFSKSIIRIL
jgi:predicted nucleotidyltransferase